MLIIYLAYSVFFFVFWWWNCNVFLSVFHWLNFRCNQTPSDVVNLVNLNILLESWATTLFTRRYGTAVLLRRLNRLLNRLLNMEEVIILCELFWYILKFNFVVIDKNVYSVLVSVMCHNWMPWICVVTKVVGRNSKGHEWKKLNSEELGIETWMISKPTRMVLNGLRKKG